MGPLLSFLSAAARLVSTFLGRSFREWSEWAAREPVAAAHELELVAALLDGRSRAYRRPDGWRARRDRRIAASLRKHARSLRSSETHDDVLAACKVKPGTMPVPSALPGVRSLP